MDMPDEDTTRWLVRRYAFAASRDKVSDRPLVLPNGRFFPDPFDGDEGSVSLLLLRMLEHAKLDDLDIELRFVDDGYQPSGGGCSTGSCGTGSHAPAPTKLPEVLKLPDGAYRMDVFMSDTRTAMTLTSAFAVSLAHIFLLETGGLDEWPEQQWRSTCEVAAHALGFGVLLSNASYMYSKGCGGAHIDRSTAMHVTEHAIPLALFMKLHGISKRDASAGLDRTQREAMSEGLMWVASNPVVVNRLQREPESLITDDIFEVKPGMPWLARVFGIGGKRKREVIDGFDDETMQALAASLKTRVASKRKLSAPDPEAERLREIVAESLREAREEEDSAGSR